jgi:hypothetical protein
MMIIAGIGNTTEKLIFDKTEKSEQGREEFEKI